MKWNESGFRPPLCTYRLNWARRNTEDGEMIEMTLSSRHRIRNSNPGGLRPSTLPLGHGGSPQYWLSHVDGGGTFCSFQTTETGNRTPNSGVKDSGANHYPRAPALVSKQEYKKICQFYFMVMCNYCCAKSFTGNHIINDCIDSFFLSPSWEKERCYVMSKIYCFF